MSAGRAWQGAIALFAIAVLSVLFAMSRSSDPEAHAKVIELLRETRSSEVVLSRLLLQVNTGRLLTYDPILTAGRNLGQSLAAVRREPAMQDHPQSVRLDRYAAVAAERRELVERLKSTDAVYRTSSVYLPILTREVMARLRATGNSIVAEAVAAWDEELFLRQHARVSALDFELTTQRLRDLGASGDARFDIELLTMHADVLVREQEAVRRLLDRVLDLSRGEILDEIYQDYMARHTAENRRAGYILYALYAVAFLSVLGLVATVVKLGHLSSKLAGSNKLLSERASELELLSTELQAHRDNLEQEVADRTADLFDSEARLMDAIETLPDGFVLFDAEDRLVICNAAFRALSSVYAEHARPGVTFDELIRRVAEQHGFRNANGGSTETWLQERIASHRAVGRNAVSTEQHQSADGRWVEVRERRTREGGIVGLRIDVTDSRRRAAAEREQDKLASLGQLAGGVAHEINNLLQPALTFADLMRDRLPADDIEGREDLDLVLTSVRKAREIVRNILLYSRKQEVTLEATDLAEATGTALAFIHGLLPPSILLHSRLDWQGGRAAINKTQLTQVLTNLVLNAAHASGNRGTIEITAGQSTPSLTDAEALGLSANIPYMLLNVTDQGAGMDAATTARIFEPFFTTKPQGEGTGLGLSVVFGILRSWKGAIAVRSRPGAGTVFTLYIPLLEPAGATPVAA